MSYKKNDIKLLNGTKDEKSNEMSSELPYGSVCFISRSQDLQVSDEGDKEMALADSPESCCCHQH